MRRAGLAVLPPLHSPGGGGKGRRRGAEGAEAVPAILGEGRGEGRATFRLGVEHGEVWCAGWRPLLPIANPVATGGDDIGGGDTWGGPGGRGQRGMFRMREDEDAGRVIENRGSRYPGRTDEGNRAGKAQVASWCPRPHHPHLNTIPLEGKAVAISSPRDPPKWIDPVQSWLCPAMTLPFRQKRRRI